MNLGTVRVLWGFFAASLLAATTVISGGPGELARPLYDGLVPLAPYRWVHPPRDLARDNQPPAPGRSTLTLHASGQSPGSVTTGDGQCTVVVNDGSIAAGPAGRTLVVTVTPLDPAAVGRAPAGTRFDGNACRFEATYVRSGAVPHYRRPLTVVLRYATGGTQIVQAVPGGGPPKGKAPVSPAWQPLHTVRYPGALHLLVADVPLLGTFAPVAPANTPFVQGPPWRAYAIAAALAAIAIVVALRGPWSWRAGRGPRSGETTQAEG